MNRVKKAFKAAFVRPLSSSVIRPWFRALLANRVPVFMLHRIEDLSTGISGHSLECVSEMLAEIRAMGLRPIGLPELVECAIQGRSTGPDRVAFTIDDGFADQIALARLFIDLEWPVTFFLLTDLVDGQGWPWDYRLTWAVNRATQIPERIEVDGGSIRPEIDELRDAIKRIDGAMVDSVVEQIAGQLGVEVPVKPPPEHQPLSWDDARDLEAAGVTFGPHACSHRVFSQLDAETARFEMAHSWERMQAELKQPLPILGWPTGRKSDFGPRDQAIARELELTAAFATDDFYAQLHGDPFALERFAMPKELNDLRQNATWIEAAKRRLLG